MIQLKQGKLQGITNNGVTAYFDIPYARSSVRFRVADPPEAWEGVRDAASPGPVFPQTKGRLSFVMGTTAEESNSSEDAFRLNIWTPEGTNADSKLPVIVFIHGGAWMTGGGAIPWYYGDGLVRKGMKRDHPFVFINFNYRLGFLGNAYLKGITDKNCSYKDVLMAFQWVRDNITEFGGDPDNIHIAGQSAGAWYAVAMMADPKWNRQFQSVSLFSFPGGADPLKKKEVTAMMNAVKKAAGVKKNSEFSEMPVQDLLDVQGAAAKKAARIGCVYMPMVEKDVIPEDILTAAAKNAPPTIKVFANTNAEETTPFVAKKQKVLNLVPTPFLRVPAKMFFGKNAGKMHRYYIHESGIKGSYNRIVAMSTDSVFANPTDELLAMLQEQGHEVKRNVFTTRSLMKYIGSCHCFDMPFLFGTFNAFANAPFLQGMNDASRNETSQTLQDEWLDFLFH